MRKENTVVLNKLEKALLASQQVGEKHAKTAKERDEFAAQLEEAQKALEDKQRAVVDKDKELREKEKAIEEKERVLEELRKASSESKVTPLLIFFLFFSPSHFFFSYSTLPLHPYLLSSNLAKYLSSSNPNPSPLPPPLLQLYPLRRTIVPIIPKMETMSLLISMKRPTVFLPAWPFLPLSLLSLPLLHLLPLPLPPHLPL
jgi:hypothetical protein